MDTSDTILFLNNEHIDRFQWDECIAASPHALVYGLSVYLDTMADGWSALIDSNYKWILPICHNKKLGMAYQFQPPFTQQLGIFARAGVEVPMADIINRLQQRFSFWEVYWNFGLSPKELPKDIEVKACTNYCLNLKLPYDSIASSYHADLKKNLKRASKAELHYKSESNVVKLIDLYCKLYHQRFPHVSQYHIQQFKLLCQLVQHRQQLVCRVVENKAGAVLASAVLLQYNGRLYNMMNATVQEGRDTAANHYLLDSIIREYGEQDIVFDFEGSDLPGVKTFYENFGATNQPYYFLKYNNLPWPAKWFKQ